VKYSGKEGFTFYFYPQTKNRSIGTTDRAIYNMVQSFLAKLSRTT